MTFYIAHTALSLPPEQQAAFAYLALRRGPILLEADLPELTRKVARP